MDSILSISAKHLLLFKGLKSILVVLKGTRIVIITEDSSLLFLLPFPRQFCHVRFRVLTDGELVVQVLCSLDGVPNPIELRLEVPIVHPIIGR